jgi:hypothetical protein
MYKIGVKRNTFNNINIHSLLRDKEHTSKSYDNLNEISKYIITLD